MLELAIEYSCLVFIAALGVFQLAAAYGQMRGVSFFTRRIYGFIFSALTAIPALIGLFTWNQRNSIGIIEGFQQFGLFSLAVFIAFIFNVVISHVIQRNKLRRNEVLEEGLEALKEVTFFQALRFRLGRRK